MEGNGLSFEDTQAVLAGEKVFAQNAEVEEIVSYKNLLDYLENLGSQISSLESYFLGQDVLLKLHQLSQEKLLADQAGQIRTKQVVIKNTQTGQVSYTPPPALEVPYLLEDLFNWINSEEAAQVHPVLKAGIVHYELERIYPFVQANDKIARAMSRFIMFFPDYQNGEFLSLEDYFDEDLLKYYLTLQSVFNQVVLDSQERDLTPWLEYFSEAVATQISKLKDKVRRISLDSRVKDKLGETVPLTEKQMIIMEYLHKYKSLQNKDFRKIFPDYSDDTVLRELKFLKQKGLVKKIGGTKKASYILT